MTRKKKILITIIVLVVLIFVALFVFGGNDNNKETTETAKTENYQETILVSGRIEALRDVTLSFRSTSGIVSRIYRKTGEKVKKGTLLASLDIKDLTRRRNELTHSLEAQEARLAKLRRGATQEEKEVQAAKTNSTRQRLANAIRSADANAIQDLISIESSLRLNIDKWFINVTSDSPRLSVSISGTAKQNLENGRNRMGSILRTNTDNFLNSPIQDTESSVERLQKLIEDLKLAGIFANQVFAEIKRAEERGSLPIGASDPISNFAKEISSSIGKTTQSLNNVLAESSALKTAILDEKSLLAGTSEEDIREQIALVERAREEINRIDVDISRSKIFAPFDGVIGEVFVKEGEAAIEDRDGTIRFISDTSLKVVVDVSELDINYFNEGEEVQAEVEAIEEKFGAVINSVNVVEKVIDNVPTYKVEFAITDQDSRLRPGLSVDIDIPTKNHENIVTVPNGAIMRNANGDSTVTIIRTGETREQVVVETGVSTDRGTTEILSGVNEGDRVVVLMP
ncbi:MAG: efflux RND transporter periplasmic adaptor subunit [Candidatus Campbellbacteria bacterium]|nr:efflux RND transporter periplasmic adaptor subunit [Candidatus Campbellbacteria bacterium]